MQWAITIIPVNKLIWPTLQYTHGPTRRTPLLANRARGIVGFYTSHKRRWPSHSTHLSCTCPESKMSMLWDFHYWFRGVFGTILRELKKMVGRYFMKLGTSKNNIVDDIWGGVNPMDLLSKPGPWLLVGIPTLSLQRSQRLRTLRVFFSVYTTVYFYFQVNLKELLAIIAVSVLLTVAVEMPFNNMRTSFVKQSSRQELRTETARPLVDGPKHGRDE